MMTIFDEKIEIREITGSLKDPETQKDTRKIQCLKCNINMLHNCTI